MLFFFKINLFPNELLLREKVLVNSLRVLVRIMVRILPKTLRISGLGYVYRHRIIANRLGYHNFAKSDLDQDIDSFLNLSLGKPGFYVELGASDGITQSNSKRLELYFGWIGILIEPEPQSFYQLKRNRSRENYFYNVAAVGFQYSKPTLDLIYSGLMTTPLVENSSLADPIEHARDGQRFLENGETTYIFSAQARTLNSIFVESFAPKNMEFLSLDVEGGEFEALNGIDHNQYRFEFMLIETQNLKKLVNFLKPLGYVYLKTLSVHDYLFKDVTK